MSGLAGFSDLAFQAAMAAYVVALICYGIELASRRALEPTALEAASAVHRSERAGSAGAVLTDLGPRPSAPAAFEHDDDDDDDGPRTPWGVLFGRTAVLITVVGVIANLASVVARGFAAGRLPLANMYEYSAVICCAAIITWLVILKKTGARPLGLFVLAPVAVLAFVAGTVLWVPAGPVQPSLNSYWKWIHVTTISASGSVLLVSGAASVMYLLRHRFDRRRSEAVAIGASGAAGSSSVELLDRSVWSRLPALPVLDKIAYRTAIVAFPVYTFAVIAGALWAEVAWGRYWGWDPKETVAFVSWVFYAGYLHARATTGWRGPRAAWINVIGFLAIVFNLFFVNMVISGLHSYAGV